MFDSEVKLVFVNVKSFKKKRVCQVVASVYDCKKIILAFSLVSITSCNNGSNPLLRKNIVVASF